MKKLIAIVVLAAAPALFAQEKTITTESQVKQNIEVKKAQKVENVKAQDREIRAQEVQSQNAENMAEERAKKKAMSQDPERRAMLKERSEARKLEQKADSPQKSMKKGVRNQSDDAKSLKTK